METATQVCIQVAEPELAAAEPTAWEVVKVAVEYIGWAWSLPQQPHRDIPVAYLSFGNQLAELA